ncbi:hypothetical protein U1Q18_033269 [Sarracenia purpurea var. burkii]
MTGDYSGEEAFKGRHLRRPEAVSFFLNKTKSGGGIKREMISSKKRTPKRKAQSLGMKRSKKLLNLKRIWMEKSKKAREIGQPVEIA